MWTPQFDGTNRHSGRKFHALGPKSPTGDRKRYSQSGSPFDPIGSFHFNLEITGITLAHFQEVQGLTVETEVVTQKEGGLNEYEHKLMGQTKYTNLVLKNGMTHSTALWDWRKNAMADRSQARKDGSVALLGYGGKELRRWNFIRGWPCKWEGPSLSGGQSQIAVETLEIAYDKLT